MGVIYKITSPTGRLYIGKTYDLRKRVNSYKCDVKKGNKDIKLHNSLRKYGWDAHVLEVIEELPDEMLNEREMYWIAHFKTYCYEYPKGLNMTKGGDGQRSTWLHNTERRKKQSQVFSGEGNPFYGKNHTEEYKAKKSKEVSEYNKRNGVKVPDWGVEKGRRAVRKPILAYSSEGIFLKEYISACEAAKDLKINRACVNNVLRGKHTHASNFVFRYKTDNYPLKIEVEIKNKSVKRPVVTVLSGKMWEHPSAQEASEYFCIPKTTINRAAMYNNGRPIRTGHEFYYKDSLNQNRPHIVGPMSLNGNY